MSHFLTP
jgi:hypothetical protein